jgi:hypothetical protein
VVGVQVALGRGEGSVAGDDPQDVHGHPGVGHPGEAGVPEIVAPQMLQAEPGDYLVPLRGVAGVSDGLCNKILLS